MDFTFTADFCFQVSGKCVYAGNTHTVQTSGYLIGTFVKFTTGV